MAINDIATLGIKVDPKGAISGASKAKKAILGIGNAANGIKSSIFSLQGAIAAIGLGALVKGAVKTSASLETLKIRLKTVTGSTEDAAIAFNMLTDFTTRTPYEIEEVASAFTKLKAHGLAPTEKSLTSFGNTASAMGKSLDQMIEAVADAATGEFERLKEFGIKAKTEGDRVKFTFQGVTTEVGKNSAEIKTYLEGIGNTKFAGAMSDQINTLNGAISNLRGSFTLFTDEVMTQGTFQLIKLAINEASLSLFGGKDSLSGNAKKAGVALRESIGTAVVWMGNAFGTLNYVWLQMKEVVYSLSYVFASMFEVIDRGFTDFTNWVNKIHNSMFQKINKVRAFFGKNPIKFKFETVGYSEKIAKIKTDMAWLMAKAMIARQEAGEDLAWGDQIEKQMQKVFDAADKTNNKIKDLINNTSGIAMPDKKPVVPTIALRPMEMKFDTEGAGGFNDQLNDLMATVGDLDTAAVGMIGNFADGLSTQLTQALMTGKASFGDFARSIIAMIVQMTIKMLIFKAISGLLDSLSFTGGTGQGFNTVRSGIGDTLIPTGIPTYASGGSVSGGNPIMVGEQGRELFIPPSSGTIIPNNKLTEKESGETQVVNVTLNLSTGVQQTVRAEVMGMMPVITKQVKYAVADARQRGGSFSKSMGVA